MKWDRGSFATVMLALAAALGFRPDPASSLSQPASNQLLILKPLLPRVRAHGLHLASIGQQRGRSMATIQLMRRRFMARSTKATILSMQRAAILSCMKMQTLREASRLVE